MAAVLFAALLLAPLPVPSGTRLLIAFDSGTLGYLVTLALLMARTSPDSMRRRAEEHDEGKWTALVLGIGIAAAMLVAIAVELHAAKEVSPTRIALAAATIFLSWAFINAMFALHYAHAYYGDAEHSAKGLKFPDGGRPDYWDFVYFAFVIGTTFQTSDVQVIGRHIRRTVAVHGAISYFFTVIVLAITVNVVAGAV